MKALRGVNIGGWLVLEKWMTPSVFSGSSAEDERTLCLQYPDRIKKHHETFMQEEDFSWIAEHGLDAVRIPVGYWVLGGEPPFIGSLAQLDFAFAMAKKYKLNVVISLHGAPGSQNGKKHSGQFGKARWHWDRNAKTKTLAIIEHLAKRYGTHDRLWGIEVLNEPVGGFFRNFVLRKFYKKAYKIIRKCSKQQVKVIINDSYHPSRWMRFMQPPTYQQVVMDTHLYQGYSFADKRAGLGYHFKKARSQKARISGWQRYKPVIVGEWSLGSGRSTFAITDKIKKQDLQRQYAKAQIESYDHALAWFFWSYKIEHKNNWHFRSLVESGIIELPDSVIIT